jgi:hypothetical protein
MGTLERIEVPDVAYLPKPIFPTLPGNEIVKEVRDWLAAANATYLWRGHTHSPPPKGATIEYVGDFALKKGTLAPCPCCTPETEKFQLGYIAWFPGENAIRLMGRDCFRKLNPEGHQGAVDRLRARQQLEKDVIFLVRSMRLKPEIQSTLAAAIPVAKQVDQLQWALTTRLLQSTGINLWTHLRDGGMLTTVIKQTEAVTRRDGTAQTNEVHRFQRLGNVAGYRLVDPARKALVPMLATAIQTIEAVKVPNAERMEDRERRQSVRLFARGLRLGREALAEITEVRRFIDPSDLGMLRRWGADPNAPIGFYIRREGLELLVGKRETDVMSVHLDQAIDTVVRALPAMSVE